MLKLCWQGDILIGANNFTACEALLDECVDFATKIKDQHKKSMNLLKHTNSSIFINIVFYCLPIKKTTFCNVLHKVLHHSEFRQCYFLNSWINKLFYIYTRVS